MKKKELSTDSTVGSYPAASYKNLREGSSLLFFGQVSSRKSDNDDGTDCNAIFGIGGLCRMKNSKHNEAPFLTAVNEQGITSAKRMRKNYEAYVKSITDKVQLKQQETIKEIADKRKSDFRFALVSAELSVGFSDKATDCQLGD